MSYELFIGDRDYSIYVYSKLAPLSVDWALNKPQLLNFALLSEDMSFGGLGVPRREEQVRLNTGIFGNNTFKGFVSAYSTMTLAGYKQLELMPANIVSTTTVGNSGAGWVVNQYVGFNVKIISGPGTGQSRSIISNTAGVLTVALWDVPPTTGSVFRISAPIFGLKVTAASEEFQLNVKSSELVLLPSLAGRRTGAIIRIMTEFLLPGKFDYDFDDDMGEFQADLEIKAGEVWSDIVAKCGTNDRSHYWVLDSKIYYAPFDDEELGVIYDLNTDPTVTGWNVSNMTVDPQANPIKNDVIVVGEECPRGMAKAFYCGDGFTGDFYLQTRAFGVENYVVVNETWEGAVNTAVWEQEGDGFVVGQDNLQINGGSGITSSYVRLMKAIELSGSIRLVHGEFQFVGSSTGRAGCLYEDFSNMWTPLTGFDLTAGGIYVGRIKAAGFNEGEPNPFAAVAAVSNFEDGDSVVVGSVMYIMRNTVTAAHDVLIAGNMIDTMNNLYAAIIGDDAGEGILYGIHTTLNTINASKVSAYVIDLWSPGGFTLSTNSAHVDVFGSDFSPQTNITAIVNGNPVGDTFITRTNHSYVLITRIHGREIYPWASIYRSVRDTEAEFGGLFHNSKIFVSFEILDTNMAVAADNPAVSIVPEKIVIYAGVHDLLTPESDPFLSYVVVQPQDMHLAINFTEIAYPFNALVQSKKAELDPITLLPVNWDDEHPEVRSLGFGIDQADATITADPSGHVLRFYSTPIENIPEASEILQIFFRVAGKAVGRVRDSVSVAEIAAMYGPPDDGVRTLVVENHQPRPRSDEDARNAAAALVVDSVNPDYHVTYKVFSLYCDNIETSLPGAATKVRPMPGRMLLVNESRFEDAPLNLLVTEVGYIFHGDHFTAASVAEITLKCGTQLSGDVLAAALRRKGANLAVQDSSTIAPIDIAELDTAYLPDSINDWGIEPYGEFNYKLGILDPKPADGDYQIEVRKADRGWGQIPVGLEDAGLIVRTPTINSLLLNPALASFSDPIQPIFLIPRTSRNKFLYMRFVKNGVYSSQSAYCKIGLPLVAVGMINIFSVKTGARTLVVDFDVPPIGFQDLYRIVFMAPAPVPIVEGEDPELVPYWSEQWDYTTFQYRNAIQLVRKEHEPEWEMPVPLRVNSANLLGEMRVVSASCFTSALLEKDKATFGIGQGVPQIIGPDLTNHYMVRLPDGGGTFIEAVGNCKTPYMEEAQPLIIDLQRSADQGGSWNTVFAGANSADKLVIPPASTLEYRQTNFADPPDNKCYPGDWLRIGLMAGSNETSMDIEVVLRWGK